MSHKVVTNYHVKGNPLYSTYGSWIAMRRRCYDEGRSYYKYYGGRGIKVCDRWIHSFQNFYEDMGKRPKNGTLDRIGNDKDYTPENCRWATRAQQVRNRRNTLTYKGMALSVYCKKVSVPYSTVLSRIQEGHSIDVAVKKKLPKKISKNTMMIGEFTLKEYCLKNKISYRLVLKRIKTQSLTPEQAVKLPVFKNQVKGMSLHKYCTTHNIPYPTVVSRVKSGMAPEEAVGLLVPS